jgi:D-3-phosphoglycerate dehydrogenase
MGKRYNVLITGPPLAPEANELLVQKASYYLPEAPPRSEAIAALAAREAVDGMIIRQGKITREVLRASPRLKVVVKHGVGVDNIDIEAASELSIPVCITPRANSQSVAEHALALMLALATNLTLHDRRLRSGIWDKMTVRGMELFGKTLGIIGLGRTGRRLADLVGPLEMEVQGFDHLLPPQRFPDKVKRVESLEELLAEADFLTIHCPKTPETVNLIGRGELQLMKSTAVVINTARGGIIDETALLSALEEGRLGGAGIDCFEKEPLPKDNPLFVFKGSLVLTPHIAGVTTESLVRMGTDAVQILFDCLEGRGLDPEVVIKK